ncbi:MAG: hypothetical protein JWM95_4181 [Gemmatimonadetes bacterium]|nr:hypothetical protein [Gemmatimonadota bacterium]
MRIPRFFAPLSFVLLAAQLGAQGTPPRTPVKTPVKATPTKPGAARTDTVKAPAPKAPAAPELPKFAYLQGVAVDSVHGDPLAAALIQAEGTSRIAITDSLGRFLLDSIEPGPHRILVDHALLDTLGITLVTDTMRFVAGEITRTVLAVPAADHLATLFCKPATRTLGPGALVGRVREPDTEMPAVGARVSLVWYDADLPGMPAGLKVKKSPRVRETTVGADGTYRLCGLPLAFEGKLQAQRKDGGATAEVTISQSESVLSLRSMSVAALPRLAATDSTGTPAPVTRGSARVSGRVLSAGGVPVVGARVGLMGGGQAALTKPNGEFFLDSLPSGTQALVVRQFGYKPTEVPVELSARAPQRVTVQLGVYVPELSPVEVISKREDGLQKVGFTGRRRGSAGGNFMDSDQIEKRHANLFTDLMRTVPGIRVQLVQNRAMLYSTRSSSGDGCVNVYVDGGPWQQLDAGDLDSFVRPDEVAAVEVYQAGQVPPQFSSSSSSCATVVVWTKTRVDVKRK